MTPPKKLRNANPKPGAPVREFPCPNEHCQWTFKSKGLLDRHIKFTHDQGLIQCKTCYNEGFVTYVSRNDSMNRHEENFNHKDKKVRCKFPNCKSVLSRGNNAKQHERNHKYKEFKCKHCGHFYHNKANLIKHYDKCPVFEMNIL